RHRSVLLSLLLASFVLRVVLALRGGEFYWPDEGRYGRATQLLDYLSAGQFRLAFELVSSPLPHNGIALFGLPSACVAAAARWLQIPIPTLSVAAAALSITSVTSIGIVFLLARKRGADQTEALLAAALMACSTSMFYYSRHLFPYDSAMALALFACLVGSA